MWGFSLPLLTSYSAANLTTNYSVETCSLWFLLQCRLQQKRLLGLLFTPSVRLLRCSTPAKLSPRHKYTQESTCHGFIPTHCEEKVAALLAGVRKGDNLPSACLKKPCHARLNSCAKLGIKQVLQLPHHLTTLIVCLFTMGILLWCEEIILPSSVLTLCWNIIIKGACTSGDIWRKES